MIDLENNSLDKIKSCSIGSTFGNDTFIYGNGSTNNNWAKGYLTSGNDKIDDIIDNVRQQLECCDCSQGFQIFHGLGGGTGSGLGSLLLTKLRDEYKDKILSTYSIVPSCKTSDIVVEPYNTTLSLNKLIELADQTFVIDNETIYNMNHQKLKINKPTYDDLVWFLICCLLFVCLFLVCFPLSLIGLRNIWKFLLSNKTI